MDPVIEEEEIVLSPSREYINSGRMKNTESNLLQTLQYDESDVVVTESGIYNGGKGANINRKNTVETQGSTKKKKNRRLSMKIGDAFKALTGKGKKKARSGKFESLDRTQIRNTTSDKPNRRLSARLSAAFTRKKSKTDNVSQIEGAPKGTKSSITRRLSQSFTGMFGNKKAPSLAEQLAEEEKKMAQEKTIREPIVSITLEKLEKSAEKITKRSKNRTDLLPSILIEKPIDFKHSSIASMPSVLLDDDDLKELENLKKQELISPLIEEKDINEASITISEVDISQVKKNSRSIVESLEIDKEFILSTEEMKKTSNSQILRQKSNKSTSKRKKNRVKKDKTKSRKHNKVVKIDKNENENETFNETLTKSEVEAITKAVNLQEIEVRSKTKSKRSKSNTKSRTKSKVRKKVQKKIKVEKNEEKNEKVEVEVVNKSKDIRRVKSKNKKKVVKNDTEGLRTNLNQPKGGASKLKRQIASNRGRLNGLEKEDETDKRSTLYRIFAKRNQKEEEILSPSNSQKFKRT